jgi:hypothetical protein
MAFEPDFTVISLPSVKADPATGRHAQRAFILVDRRRMVTSADWLRL